MSNPFNPAFGKKPEHFFGREEIIRSITSSVSDNNSPWRTTLVTGLRGSGKTALLSDIRIKLDSPEIVIIYVVPNEAILDSVLSQLYRQLPKSVSDIIPEFKGVSLNIGLSVDFERDNKSPNFTESFTYQFMVMIDAYMKQNKHIIFMVDEAQKHTESMRVFISIYQDLIMREYSISMIMAALPSVVSGILNDDILTFLRRAKHVELENVELMIVEHEFKRIFIKADNTLSENIVTNAAVATCGYPYLIQLVGYYLWDDMHSDIDDLLDTVLIKSKAELFRNVHKLIFDDLSPKDREFVFAMCNDEEYSSVSDIGERLNKKKNHISLYRDRLISAGVVKPYGHGLLCFTYPYMREYCFTRSRIL